MEGYKNIGIPKEKKMYSPPERVRKKEFWSEQTQKVSKKQQLLEQMKNREKGTGFWKINLKSQHTFIESTQKVNSFGKNQLKK